MSKFKKKYMSREGIKKEFLTNFGLIIKIIKIIKNN